MFFESLEIIAFEGTVKVVTKEDIHRKTEGLVFFQLLSTGKDKRTDLALEALVDESHMSA